jgi:hypothetical protein
MKREDIISDILIKNKYTKGVEVGTLKGEFAKSLLSRWDNGVLYMVDVWRKMDNYVDSNNNDEDSGIILDCIKNISNFVDRAHMMRMSSDVACKLFSDESLDFVYLDANHSYDGFIKDFNNWYPKVKKGGLIAGHDYMMIHWYDDKFLENKKDKAIYLKDAFLGNFGVNTAIDEITKRLNIQMNFTPELFSTWYFTK